jgi:hypothetical protein
MITKRKRIPEAETLEIGMQVASGLRHAYQRGLIHRDIKPGNILFSEAGMPKVVDFGLAEFHTEAKAPQKDGIWGTPYYIAPEKVAGEKEDFRSDIYSLGGTLFHALAGRAPFEANTATDVVIKNLTTPALSLKTFAPDITDETARAVGRMLIKNRAARYNSYDTLIHDLQLAKQHLTTRGVHRVSQDVKQKVKKSMVRAAVIIGAVALAIGVCGYLLWKQRDQIFGRPPPPDKVVITNAAPSTTTGSGTNAQPIKAPPTPAWKLAFTTATSSLNQGKYAGAIAQYQDALKRQDDTDPVRPWVQAQIGLCHLLAYQVTNALAAYSALLPTNASPTAVDGEPTPERLPSSIALIMTDRATPKVLLSKIDSMPDWCKAMVRLHLGVRSLSHEEFTMAQKLLYEYSSTPPPDDTSWAWTKAFELRANSLALECESFNTEMPAVLEYQKQKDYDSALAKLQSIRNSVSYPTLVAKVRTLETSLQKEVAAAAEEKRVVEEARQKEVAEKDAQLIAKIDAGTSAYAANYLFEPLATAYKTAIEKMQTEKGKQEAEQKQARYQTLSDLKAFAISSLNQKPYAGGAVITRAGSEVKGTLYKADAEKLYFKIPYGELPQSWRSIPPVEVAKIFQSCIKGVTDSEQKAKLEAALATFREELKVK